MDEQASTSLQPGRTDRVWRALGVSAGERTRVVWAGSLFFVMLASVSIGLNAADALFFLRFGVDSLPWMIMFSGLAVMAVTIGYSAGLTTYGSVAWPWSLTLGFAALLAAERMAIGADLPGVYPVLWLTGQVVMYVCFTLLWDIAGELCDARQAKRIFPLLMSAGIAGSVTGNALTGPVAALMGAENLLIVEALGLGAAGLLAKTTAQRFISRSKRSSDSVLSELRVGLQTTIRVPLFRLLAGVGAAMSVLFFLVMFPFSEVATASFETEEALAGFLGLFSSVATAATFLVSLFVAKRLFTKFGVIAVLLIVAVVYVAGFSLWLVSFGLLTATLFRGVQWVAINALGATAFSSVFNVLTGTTRSKVRDFISAVPVQIGTIVGGGILLAGAGLSNTTRTVFSLGVAVAFLLVVLPMRKAYAAALVEAVRHGLSDVFTATMPGLQKPHHDADTLAALMTGLHEASAGRRRVTAAILGEVGGDAGCDALHEMLSDQDEGVRLAALQSLGALEIDAMQETALALLSDASARVRIKAMGFLDRSRRTEPAVIAALHDDDVEVRAHAARIVGGAAGSAVISDLVASGDPGQLAAAMRCVIAEPTLGNIEARDVANHPDRQVRTLAAEMLGAHTDSVPTLCTMLDDRSSDVRTAAARSLAHLDQAAARDALENGSRRARDAILGALVDAGEPTDYLQGWAAAELDRATELHRIRMAIARRKEDASPASDSLVRILEQRERMLERWVVTALATEETKHVLPLVARGAISGEPEVRAEAFEAVESLTDRNLARRLVALLEDPEERVLVDRVAALHQLASDDQRWHRALALRTLYEELSQDLKRAAHTAEGDSSPVVQTAVPFHPASRPIESEAMTIVDAFIALQHASILGQVYPDDLEAIAKISEERRFDAGETVFEQGSLGGEMVVVVRGSALVEHEHGNGFQTVAEAGPGEPLGELALLRHKPRMARVIAGREGLTALAIDGERFLGLMEEQPELASALLATLAERIAHVVDVEGVGDLGVD